MSIKGLLRLAVLALLVVAFQGTWALAGTTGSIQGVVTDSDGHPIAGATVTAISPSQTGHSTTDSKGFFAVLAETGYTGSMNIENEDEFYYPSYDANQNFTEQYKRGFKAAHEFLKTMVPPVSA